MAATLPAPILYDPLIHAASILPQIATIHAECILRSGTLASLHPSRNPDTGELAFDPAKVLAYWQPRHDQVLAGQREIILQFTDSTETELAGVVSLHLPTSETGPFRADVEKLLVSPRHRYKGIARRLMQKLEEVARGRGRSLLRLDTTLGSGAEFVYPKLGYKEIGVIPKYGIHPLTGELVDELFFYKDLKDQE